MNYKEIEFGEISAEYESSFHPELIEKGYYDYQNTIQKLLHDRQFLVLGGKGSGKSLIGEKLKTYEHDSAHFISLKSLCQFPYKPFKNFVTGKDDQKIKYSKAWEWIFLVCALESFDSDHGKAVEHDSHFHEAIEQLRKNGILPAASLGDVVKVGSKLDLKLNLGILSAGVDVGERKLVEDSFDSQKEFLRQLVAQCKSNNYHYIVIDGLDDVLSDSNDQFSIIAILIKTAYEFNMLMRKNSVPMKVIVLCRTDIFEKTSDPNQNKILNGSTIRLDWYQDQVESTELELIKLINQRAELKGVEDVFSEFFYEKYEDKDVRKYLLENTRYTPRDFVQLLTYLKNTYNCHKFKTNEIAEAVKKYSKDYFWNEIKDELSGYVSGPDISKIKMLFTDLGKKEFTLAELEEKANSRDDMKNLNFSKILKILYDCGALSLVYSNDRLQSKWKNESDFDIRQKMLLHRAMHKALNII